MEANKTIQETNILLKNISEDNIKLKEENKKMFLHFTKEFMMLRGEIKEVLETAKQTKLYDKLPDFPLTSHSAVMDFETQLRTDKEMQSQLVSQPICVFLFTIFKNMF